MLVKICSKLKSLLKDERTKEEKIKSYENDVASYRNMTVAFAIVFAYTIICSLIYPEYKPSWISKETWLNIRNCWFIYLSLMLSNMYWWLKAAISKNKLLKKVA